MIFTTTLSPEEQVSEAVEFFKEHFPASVAHEGALDDLEDELDEVDGDADQVIDLILKHQALLLRLPV
jgi:hypothetical protein